MRRARLLVAAGCVAAIATMPGCGRGEQSPRDVVRAASRETARVTSAELTMSVRAAGGSGPKSTEFGFTLSGPFDLGGTTPLPVAELAYEQRVKDASERVTFISTGTAAFVEIDETAYQLPDSMLAGLRRERSDDADSAGLAELRFDRWVSEPRRADGPDIDGVSTDHLTGTLNVEVAVPDLVRLASRLGAAQATQPLSDVDAAALQRVAKGSTVELFVGRDDDVLRRLELTIALGAGSADTLPPTLREMVPVQLTVRLELVGIGKDVTVDAPTRIKPFADLPRR